MKYLVLLFALLAYNLFSAETLSIKNHIQHEDFELSNWGRGIAVAPDKVLTALHVVEDPNRKISVKIDGKWVDATIVARDEQNDLALLHIPNGKLKFSEILDMPKLITQASPGLNEPVQRLTVVDGMKVRVDGMTTLKDPHDVGGMSGGPVMIEDKIIGILSAAGRDSEGVFCIIIGPEPIRKLMDKVAK